MPEGTFVFLGDSIISRLPTGTMLFPSVNYAIGGQTSAEILERARAYRALDRASAVIIHCGVNDCSQGKSVESFSSNLTALLELIPRQVPSIVCSVSPILRFDTRPFSEAAKRVSATRRNAIFADFYASLSINGRLRQQFDVGDGVHPSASGNRIIMDIMLQAIHAAQASRIASTFAVATSDKSV